MSTLRQIVKFVVVGTSNTAVDFLALNLLMFIAGIATGIPFSIFKGTSFLIAVANSYFWNKRWTFRSDKQVFIPFLAIATIGFFLNVGVASFVVTVVGPQFGLSARVWANLGAGAGTLVVMTSNFLGYKFLVFRK